MKVLRHLLAITQLQRLVVAVVPASGQSRRFGSDKRQALIGGVPMLQRVVQLLRDAGAARVIVVDNNPDPDRGMFSSIQIGLADAVMTGADVILVHPADMPFVRADTVRAVTNTCARTGRAVCPRHGGKRGHPLAFPLDLARQLLAVDPATPLNEAFAAIGLVRLEIDVDDPGVLRDVDTPADLSPHPPVPARTSSHLFAPVRTCPHQPAPANIVPVISLFHHMLDLRRRGLAFALATVVRTHGSTPQVAGAKLVLDDEGKFVGTLGGGCVEADAMDAARDVMAKGGRTLRAYELTEDLAWNSGLVCGGTMWILAERGDDALTIDGRDRLDDLVRAAAGESDPLAIRTRFRGGKRGEFLSRTIEPAEGAPTPRVVRAEDDDELIDVIAGKPRVVIAGGGHVSLAIMRQAQLLDFDVTVLEDRPHFAGKERFPGAIVIEADVAETIASFRYGWHTFLVIATRGHKMDGDCTLAAVQTNARYIGLLGSRRKKVMIDAMLREHGVDEARIQSIRSPIGLNLGGRTPAEIALAVMAEITQERYR